MSTWPTPLWVGWVPADEPNLPQLLAELSTTLMQITGDAGTESFSLVELRTPGVCVAAAKDQHGTLWGCGVLRPMDTGEVETRGTAVELKRMFARAGSRGVGRAMLAFLEPEAKAQGYGVIRLSTRRVNRRAVNFYAQQAYLPCLAWGRYVGREASVCLEKRL